MVETRSAAKLANGVGAASSSSSNSSTTNTNGGTKLVDRKSQKTEQTHEPRKMPPTSSRKVNVEGSSNNAINGDIKHSGLSTTKTGNRHQPAVPVAVIGAANNKRSYGTHDDEDDRKMPAKATQSIAANVGINLFSDNEGENNDQESVIAIPSEDDDDSVVLVHPYRHFATKEEQEMTDAKLAASLQSAETKARDHRKQQELDFMKKSHAGRAVLLVEKVIALLLKPEYVKEGIEPLGRDDAVFLAEQLFAMQAELQQKKISSKKSQKDDSAPPKGARKSNKKKAIAPNTKEIPTHVSIGYHYTSQVNLDSIRTDGLLTIEDRQAATHTNMRNIAYFGNGIYTGTNPHAFSNFGDVGLLVAVLKGTEKRVGSRGKLSQKERKAAKINTVIGNKGLGPSSREPFYDEVILQKSNQVLPLVKYQRDKIEKNKFADMLWSIHQQVQQVLDEYFNESITTTLTRVRASTKALKPKPRPKKGSKAAKSAAGGLPASQTTIGAAKAPPTVAATPAAPTAQTRQSTSSKKVTRKGSSKTKATAKTAKTSKTSKSTGSVAGLPNAKALSTTGKSASASGDKRKDPPTKAKDPPKRARRSK